MVKQTPVATGPTRTKREYDWRAQGIALNYDEYLDMQATQEHECAICNDACSTGKDLAVDHDHATGLVRGLLCARCNRALGGFRDNLWLISRALEYLLRNTNGKG